MQKSIVNIIRLDLDDPRLKLIAETSERLNREMGKAFFHADRIVRTYTKKDLEEAELFTVSNKRDFGPSGEECGTIYEDNRACLLCGANAPQFGPLRLKSGSIPNADFTGTYAPEYMVSAKLVDLLVRYDMKGLKLGLPVVAASRRFVQCHGGYPVEISSRTVVGVSIFDLTTTQEGREIYKCSLGHTIGKRVLSEVYVEEKKGLRQFDFFSSTVKVGLRRGPFRQRPILLCSPRFREMTIKEKLKGFEFEVAHFV